MSTVRRYFPPSLQELKFEYFNRCCFSCSIIYIELVKSIRIIDKILVNRCLCVKLRYVNSGTCYLVNFGPIFSETNRDLLFPRTVFCFTTTRKTSRNGPPHPRSQYDEKKSLKNGSKNETLKTIVQPRFACPRGGTCIKKLLLEAHRQGVFAPPISLKRASCSPHLLQRYLNTRQISTD